MKYHWLKDSCTELKLPPAVCELIASEAPLRVLLETWICGAEGEIERAVAFGNGVDDIDSTIIDSVFLHFSEGNHSCGSIFMTLRDIRDEYRRVAKLPWVQGKDPVSQSMGIDSWYKRQERDNGAEFDAELLQTLLPREGAIRCALSHAITLGGSFSFSSLSESTKEELFQEDFPSIELRFENIVAGNFRFFDLESNYGWSGDIYTDLSSAYVSAIRAPKPRYRMGQPSTSGEIIFEESNEFFQMSVRACSFQG